MEELIKEALKTSCKIWNAKPQDVKNHKCRLKNTIMAKRMFIYYLKVYLDFKHKDIKKYIKNCNHATSVYHVQQFKNDIKLYEPMKDTFTRFIRQMTAYSIYGVGYKQKKEQIEKLKKEILYFKLK